MTHEERAFEFLRKMAADWTIPSVMTIELKGDLHRLAEQFREVEREAQRNALLWAADRAAGMTGPGNTIDQCAGYSDACLDIAKCLRNAATKGVERGTPKT